MKSRNIYKSTWNVLNARIILLIAGFLLTGVIGGCLSQNFQRKAWERQAQFEVLKIRLDEEKKAMEETLLLINKRLYTMQKVFWALENQDEEKLSKLWIEYDSVKTEWNLKLHYYRSRIGLLFSAELSNVLLAIDKARNGGDTESIHGIFYSLNCELTRMKNEKNKEVFIAQKEKCEKLITKVGNAIDLFSVKIVQMYLDERRYLDCKTGGI